MDDWSLPKPRLAALLDHFAAIEEVREPWRVMYPLREVLFLVVCATVANCDDYEDIVDWGEANLGFLRRFSEFHWGVPCADWAVVDEPDRSGAVLGRLQGLGGRGLAGPARTGGHRRQDLAPQP